MKTRNQEVLLNKFIDLNNEKIDLNCPICKEILTQPVTLPCSHNFCKNCLETSIKVLCQQCPCCRKRFSHWYRQAIKTNQLVNKHLWKKIRENYGDLLENEQKNNINYQRFALSGNFSTWSYQIEPLTSRTLKNFQFCSEFSSQNGVLSDEKIRNCECPRPFVLIHYTQIRTCNINAKTGLLT